MSARRTVVLWAFQALLAGCSSPAESTTHPSGGQAGAGGGVNSGGGGSSSGSAGQQPAGSAGTDMSAGEAGTAGSAEPSGAAGSAGVGGTGVTGELEPWPGPVDVVTVPATGLIEGNVSGITYQPAEGAAPAVLWATANIPGNLYRLLPDGAGFATDPNDGWSSGKRLRFPDGQGAADAEGVTFAASIADGLYVASEHDNDVAATSRMSILRYDVTQAGASLTATHEWNVTAALPAAGANLGIEAITWVPDEYLTERAFVDEATGQLYDPSLYAEHGAGLFFVGVESTGKIYGFALNHADESFQLLATITSSFQGVMSLEYDRDAGYLWFGCDFVCQNRTGVLAVDTRPGSATLGHFIVLRTFERPNALPDTDNEGIAIAPETECEGGFKPFFWTDDAALDGFAIRKGRIPCGSFL